MADDIQAFKKRDKHLVAEQCLDVFPLYSTAVRQHVRNLIVKHLSHECYEDNQGMCHNGCGRILNEDSARGYFGDKAVDDMIRIGD